MPDKQAKRQRPPYASARDLREFFDRMSNMQEPTLVDNDWVDSFKLAAAQPSAIVSVLKWLRIVDQKGASLGVWDEVRIPSSRQAKLEELVRASYTEIFEQFDDISKATMDDLTGAFIRAYKSGDPGRPITCFIAVCNLAGIPIAAQPKTRSRRADDEEKSVTPKHMTKEPEKPSTASGAQITRTTKAQTPPPPPPQYQDQGVTILLNVEIPAEWSEEQIRERLDVIRRATEQGRAADGS